MRVRGMMGGRGGYNTGHALGRTLCPAEIDVVCETGVAEVPLLRRPINATPWLMALLFVGLDLCSNYSFVTS